LADRSFYPEKIRTILFFRFFRLLCGSPRRARSKEFLIKKYSELCELCASVVNTPSQETRKNLFFNMGLLGCALACRCAEISGRNRRNF
jgi:hypothetical protein